jgi:general secretion pathway protein N
MNAAAQRRLTPLLAGTAVSLAVLWLALLAGLGRGVHWEPPRAAGRLPAAGKAAALPPPLPSEHFAAVWQQSLFSPDRKPEAHAVSGGSSLGDLELTGIILTPQVRIALLHDKDGKQGLRVREGQTLPDGSATLVEVKSRAVIFDGAQGRTELKLPAGAPIDAVAAPVAAEHDARPPLPEPPPAARAAPQDAAAEPAAVQRVTSMGRAAPATPPPQYNPQQLERLRRLKAAILQRRATGQTSPPEGAH